MQDRPARPAPMTTTDASLAAMALGALATPSAAAASVPAPTSAPRRVITLRPASAPRAPPPPPHPAAAAPLAAERGLEGSQDLERIVRWAARRVLVCACHPPKLPDDGWAECRHPYTSRPLA